ncbi:methyl-accepting chemotaxis protein [Geminocystis herdmanii]|uniref:methyl-accepting chemotaxis protein n=1 Tax=Geminocystis herdmanii TaxID=669359 RepID=UPI00034B5B6C|nr:methyl-accepting chemotaxis protein [Geminocystis herdmanii]
MTQTSPQQPNQLNPETQTNNLPTNIRNSTSENNVNGIKPSPENNQNSSSKQGLISWVESKNLRFKFISSAVALGVIPIIVVGSIVSVLVSTSFKAQIKLNEEEKVNSISTEVNLLVRDRLLDIETLGDTFSFFPAFRNRNKAELTKKLTAYQEQYGYYDTLSILDNQGNVIAQTKGTPIPNLAQRNYILAAKAANGTIVSQPMTSLVDGTYGVYFITVLKNPITGQSEGFLRARVPVKILQEMMAKRQNTDGEIYYMADEDDQIFVSSEAEILTPRTTIDSVQKEADSVTLEKLFPQLELEDMASEVLHVTTRNTSTNSQQFVTIKALENEASMGEQVTPIDLDWKIVVGGNTGVVLKPVDQALNSIFLGILVSAIGVGYIAYLLAGRFVTPIEETTLAVKQISQGDLDIQVPVSGKDELADLGNSINDMTSQLKTLLSEQQMFASQSTLLKNMTLEMTKAFNISEVFEIAVTEIRQALQSDRVVVYSFDENWQGTIIAESVDRNYPQALGARILDPCFADKYVEKYIQGRVQATPDIYKAGLTECHLKQLEPFAVKANLVAPIVANGKLLGLLIAHQCSAPRNWELNEIEFFAQTATQMGLALERVMLMQSQQLDTFLSTKLKDISFKIAESLTKEKIFEVATNMGREALKTDRVIIYTFDQDWKGTVIVESVDPKYPRALGANIKDPCFADKYVDKYKQGRVQATNNIYTAGLTSCHIQQLEPFEVKANLVTPVIVEGSLLGLLIAHQCDAPRQWTESESIFLSQLATQIGPALERIQLLAKQRQSELEQRQAREIIQQRALELLMQVDPVSQGDLTIRATVTEDEIGTIADSYNATIESLRRIVTQVQGGTKAVNDVVNQQEQFVENLATEIIRQADDINIALEKIQTLAFSARMVLDNAEQAEEAVKQANRSVEEGEVAMNRTVDGILAIRETVAETAKKVKRLGESTQKISKVVNLIGSFADQTNLLALNASIEAAHAGEEGRGFAVVAEEVRSLARQSAQATAEIEKVVAEIQEETNDVVKAMESGTEQVVEGTRLVEETRASLTNITAASAQINQLVTAIAAAAAEQSQTSEDITETMADVAIISNETSTAVTQVSRTFKKLLKVSENLQQSVSKFKVN